MRKLALMGVAILVSFSLVSCDMGPDCIEGHTEMQWVPQPVYNPSTGQSTVQMRWLPQYVCDKYEDS